MGERAHFSKLFLVDHDLERWDVRARRASVGIDRWSYTGTPIDETDERKLDWGERFIVLIVERGRDTLIASHNYTPKSGDVAVIAVHDRERDEAEEVLRKLGWEALEEPDSPEATEEAVPAAPAAS